MDRSPTARTAHGRSGSLRATGRERASAPRPASREPFSRELAATAARSKRVRKAGSAAEEPSSDPWDNLPWGPLQIGIRIPIWMLLVIIVGGLLLPTWSYYSLQKRTMDRFKMFEKKLVAEATQRASLDAEYVDLERMSTSLRHAKAMLQAAAAPAPTPKPVAFIQPLPANPGQQQAFRNSVPSPAVLLRGAGTYPPPGSARMGSPTGNCDRSESVPWSEGTPEIYTSSQFGHYLKGKKDGYFVDIGAGDGIFQSKSYFFEKHLCWRGIAVEPTVYEYAKLASNRPRSTTLNSAVTVLDGQRSQFWDVTLDGKWTGWSGFEATFSPSHRSEIEKNVNGGGQYRKDVLTVPSIRLKTLLEKYAPDVHQIDLLTISTEGHELDILKSADFFAVDIIVVQVACPIEEMQKCNALQDLMMQNGYNPPQRMWSGHVDLIFTKAATPAPTGPVAVAATVDASA